MLIWRGRGLVVLLAILVFIVVEAMVDGSMGGGYYASHAWPKILAAVLSAIPIWFIGVAFENGGGSDSFWFVPVKWWAPVILIVGIFVGISATEAAPEPAKATDPAPVAEVKSEPAPQPAMPVAPNGPILPKPRYHASVVPTAAQPTARVAETERRSDRPAVQFATISQVYADSATHLYYAENCAHPENAYRLAKSAAKMQGYKPAPNCAQ